MTGSRPFISKIQESSDLVNIQHIEHILNLKTCEKLRFYKKKDVFLPSERLSIMEREMTKTLMSNIVVVPLNNDAFLTCQRCIHCRI